MKKSALLAVLAAIALSACSSFGKDKAAESNAPEVTAPAAETPAAQ